MISIRSIALAETAGAVSVLIDPPATLSFDLSGRPIGLYENGFYLARGQDGRYVEKKWRGRERHLRALTPEEGEGVGRRISALLEAAIGQLPWIASDGRLAFYDHGRRRPITIDRARAVLGGLVDFNQQRRSADEESFRRVYGSVGILPPDQYLAVVLRVAEGCAWNRCSFCDFYSGVRPRVLGRREIARHARAAAAYFGAGLCRRCSVFLGDADAFAAPPEALLWACRVAARFFPRQATPQRDGVGGIYAFAETDSLLRWSVPDLERAAAAGVRRVYVGLETGSDRLRRWLRKRGGADDAREAVSRLKAAGLGAGLIVLLGPGGRENASEHAARTRELLARLPLGAGDMVYFSPLRAADRGEYARRMAAEQWTPLTPAEMAEQRELIAAGTAAKTASYDVREFVY